MDREEEEIMGPLPKGHSGDSDDLLNFDTVSEKVLYLLFTGYIIILAISKLVTYIKPFTRIVLG